ncbi:type IV secretory system conjugative DNA transfer family protein [Commensalibacter nepenthis]|uniref:Type IV secretory system conjugative DNA transfer family protein n=1 Tax=Commensalibacter nepenthis TaxID=3043872 RepID=A0ABT6QAD7_9PROT|nr:type IV secretory system conjugative DNA transfer family protein [Commensalibacter sp. TBRC 10068]MDI2113873.1 type IV secretory system conjugative DNA transfer family protein [Commensalibacter sp. TBRC 10068]
MSKIPNNMPFHSRKNIQTARKKFPFLKPIFICVALCALILIVNAVATQYIASRFGYNPIYLGSPNKLGFYPIFSWIEWQKQYGSIDKIHFYMVDCAVLLFCGLFALMTIGLVLLIRRRKAAPVEGLHGTAKFCETEKEVKETGLLIPDASAGNAVVVGGWTDSKGKLRYLRHQGAEHIMAVAPTRSGKGVGLIVPTLLSWTQSTVVNDIKGELFAMTSGWRKNHANNIVLKFDPASPEGSCSYNVLAEVRLNTPYEVGDVQNMVTIIVDPDGKGIEGDHWASSAFNLLVGVILYCLKLAFDKGESIPNLFDIGWALSDPNSDNAALWNAMLKYVPRGQSEIDPVISQVGRDLLSVMENGEEEYTSVLTTTKRFLNIYRDPIVRKNVSSADFKVIDLVRSERPVSLYLVVKPSDKDRLTPIMRLLTNQIMRGLTRDALTFDKDNRPIKPHKHDLLMMTDEFPSLGKLEIFEESMAFVAGYGIKCYIIIQDFNQLWKIYSENEAITSNCHIRIAYAPNRQETAEKLSEMTGTMTVNTEEISESSKQLGMTDNISRSYQNVSRPLMTPHEISTMKSPKKDSRGLITESGDMLVFVAGHNPIYGTQPLYFLDPVWSARSKVPPVENTDRISQSGIISQNINSNFRL